LSAYASTLLVRAGAGRGSAGDIVQSVFCRILETDRAALERLEDVTAWLVASTRNAALNSIRSTRRAIDRHVEHAHGRREGVRTDSQSPSILDLLNSLPDDLAELVYLKHAAALTFDQIALCLGENRSTLASRYRTAIELLKRGASRSASPREGLREGRREGFGAGVGVGAASCILNHDGRPPPRASSSEPTMNSVSAEATA
jgi:RNA polymerase sigma factor (sigma-70 family)